MTSSIFNIDLDHLQTIDVDAPLRDAESRSCEHYIDRLANAASTARSAGDEATAAIFELLCELACLHPQFDVPDRPFAPRIIRHNGRSLSYQDLPPADCEAVKYLARRTQDFAMAARLFDLSWILNKRDAQSGSAAAESYLSAAHSLISETRHWFPALAHFQRAIWIASKLGRNKPLHTRVCRIFIEDLRVAASEHHVKTLRLMELAQRSQCGEPAELSELAWNQAEARVQARDYEGARQFLELAAIWYRRNGDPSRENECLRKVAEAFIYESSLSGDDYVRALHLRSAIEAARTARLDHATIAGLQRDLAAAQKSTVRNLKPIYFTFEGHIDPVEIEAKVCAYIEAPTIQMAVQKLITVATLVNLDALRSSVEESVGQTLFRHIFRTVKLDREGRPNVVRNPMVGATDEARKVEMEREMFEMALFQWDFRAAFFIQPARRYIEMEFRPTVADLFYLVRSNPFVTEGHEQIILRGVLAGFHNDFLLASALLVPQVEQMMRRALEAHGVDTSTFVNDGTQMSKVFGGIFALPETKKFFGDSFCFELRGHLIEKTGYDLRNRVAHGLANDSDLMSAGAVGLWWLVVNMLACGLMPRIPTDA